MLLRTFQAFLVTFLVIFTAAGAILLLSGVISLLVPSAGSNGGIKAVAGGLGAGTFEIILIVAVLLGVAGVFLIARRHRLR